MSCLIGMSREGNHTAISQELAATVEDMLR